MKTNKKLPSRSLSFSLALLSAFPSLSLASTELARVNGTVITLEEFNKKYEALVPLYPNKIPSKETVLNDLIKRELGIQEAKRLKLDQDAEVRDEMNSALYQAFLKKSLGTQFEKLAVTETDIKNYYKKNPEIRTSHIFISFTPGATAVEQNNALKRAQEIQQKLKKGMDFSEAAQKFSESASAPLGGDLDYQTKDKLDPTYYRAALDLKTVGSVSNIIKTPFGFHIIKLTGIKKWNDVDRALIRQVYTNEKREELFNQFMASLKKKSKISVKTSLIQ